MTDSGGAGVRGVSAGLGVVAPEAAADADGEGRDPLAAMMGAGAVRWLPLPLLELSLLISRFGLEEDDLLPLLPVCAELTAMAAAAAEEDKRSSSLVASRSVGLPKSSDIFERRMSKDWICQITFDLDSFFNKGTLMR